MGVFILEPVLFDEVFGGVVSTPLLEEGATTSTQLQEDVYQIRCGLYFTNILLSCLLIYLFICGVLGKGWRK